MTAILVKQLHKYTYILFYNQRHRASPKSSRLLSMTLVHCQLWR
nr:MAG TPA: hypothetical protein [Caudoviricetes sp.]